MLVKWSFSRRSGGYVRHTRLRGCAEGKNTAEQPHADQHPSGGGCNRPLQHPLWCRLGGARNVGNPVSSPYAHKTIYGAQWKPT
jgi:hypothetical protein